MCNPLSNDMCRFLDWLRGDSPGITNYRIEVSLCSDPGCQRPVNEDCVQFFSPPGEPQSALAVLADGMGGHNAGEVASREAVQTLGTRYLSGVNSNPIKCLKSGLLQANAHLFSLANTNAEWFGMGTTVTALLISQGKACLGHVGDSRLYRYRGQLLEQLSLDHTLVAAMIRDGYLSPEEALRHPDRNIVTRALGTNPQVDVDISSTEWPIQLEDIYLLCSDGLYDLLPDRDIVAILDTHRLPEACQALVDCAKSRGGYDNISVILLAIREKQSLAAAPATKI